MDLTERGSSDAGTARAERPTDSSAHTFRTPRAEDAKAVSELIAACPPLDPNSLYCNLLQCTHFAPTCILAERDGEIEGWVSGYRPPVDDEAIFVWQVAVSAKARGHGLGVTMLDALLHQPAVADARRLITTVTPTNHASRRMFAALARRHGAELNERPWFDRDRHFGGGHESEELLSIEPLPRRLPKD